MIANSSTIDMFALVEVQALVIFNARCMHLQGLVYNCFSYLQALMTQSSHIYIAGILYTNEEVA